MVVARGMGVPGSDTPPLAQCEDPARAFSCLDPDGVQELAGSSGQRPHWLLGYSTRSAIMGSTRVARRAGTTLAMSATAASSPATARNVIGRQGEIS